MAREADRAAAGPERTASRPPVLSPVVAGALLDLVDLATLGPIGLWAGLALGGVAGWVLATGLGVPRERRLRYALVAGVYCMLPYTAWLPAGTLVGALVRWRERSAPPLDPAASKRSEAVVEAEYESSWDPPTPRKRP